MAATRAPVQTCGFANTTGPHALNAMVASALCVVSLSHAPAVDTPLMRARSATRMMVRFPHHLVSTCTAAVGVVVPWSVLQIASIVLVVAACANAKRSTAAYSLSHAS